MYILIEFTEEKCLAIIPENWRLGRTSALWPNTQNIAKLQKMVRLKQDPDEQEWESYPMRVLYENARDVRLFTVLEQIKSSQLKQQKTMESILKIVEGNASQQTAEPVSRSDIPEDIEFPLNNLEELNAFEVRLEDINVQKSVINHLSVVGGKTPKDMVRRVLKNTVKSSLASQYNWYGKKGKMPFGKLRLTTVLQKAVRKVKPDCSELEVELATREWLRTATDRDGGRKRRHVDMVPEPVPDHREQDQEISDNDLDNDAETDVSDEQ
ncbi:uncharacterized protein LOC110449299 [Mizuhopecten yessoensis]|uniref:uncharacterized protein LOC110449299 n=1 Tax=Mizuhopecten yessoensis TaxID=6573 RepID=UPI000B4587DD|nr:uncharacterized protein LOC110449299 [Mizuhopecten yessoensis]